MKCPKVETLNPKIPAPENMQDWYSVNGVKYLREDLVNQKMDGIMERIAKALEIQSECSIAIMKYISKEKKSK